MIRLVASPCQGLWCVGSWNAEGSKTFPTQVLSSATLSTLSCLWKFSRHDVWGILLSWKGNGGPKRKGEEPGTKKVFLKKVVWFTHFALLRIRFQSQQRGTVPASTNCASHFKRQISSSVLPRTSCDNSMSWVYCYHEQPASRSSSRDSSQTVWTPLTRPTQMLPWCRAVNRRYWKRAMPQNIHEMQCVCTASTHELSAGYLLISSDPDLATIGRPFSDLDVVWISTIQSSSSFTSSSLSESHHLNCPRRRQHHPFSQDLQDPWNWRRVACGQPVLVSATYRSLTNTEVILCKR